MISSVRPSLNLLGQTIAEVGVPGIGTQVVEREHYDRRLRRCLWKEGRAFSGDALRLTFRAHDAGGRDVVGPSQHQGDREAQDGQDED
jgi:hypothetical protein